MKQLVLKVVHAADGSPTSHDGRYVVAWNPHTEAGVLELTSTDDLTKARRFVSFEQLQAEWQAVSQVESTRPWDHKPNRPLMAVTCEVLELCLN